MAWRPNLPAKIKTMALIAEIYCKECGKTKYEVTDHSSICVDCRSEIKANKRMIHLLGLRSLTVKQRLEIIEAQLYDLNIAKPTSIKS